MYDSWDMEQDPQNFFFVLDRFLPFYTPNNSENHNFEEIKNT